MPLEKLLSPEENASNLAHHEHHLTPSEIIRILKLHPPTVTKFPLRPNVGQAGYDRPPNGKLSSADVRDIKQLFVRYKKAPQIANMRKVVVGFRRIRNGLSSSPILHCTKDQKAPHLIFWH